jgi:hypothetical protein
MVQERVASELVEIAQLEFPKPCTERHRVLWRGGINSHRL